MKWFIVALVALTSALTSAVCPEFLGENTFLEELVSHELVSILVVILTVTMASVANIHLALGRFEKSMSEQGIDVKNLIADARMELSENAWYIFGSFCVLIVVLILKGSTESIFWISAYHSVALVIIALNLAILYDIYKSVYLLVSMDAPSHNGQHGDDGSEIGH